MKSKYILPIVLFIVAIIFATAMLHYKKAYETQTTQTGLWKAEADTITKKWNKNAKEWEFSRLGYQATEKQLKQFLKDKDAELYELAKKKTIREVTKIETVIKFDTIVNTIVKDGIHYATISDKWMQADIVSRPDSTSLKQQINMPLTISKGVDGRITASTPVPYIDIIELKGFTKIQPDKKRNWKYWVGGIVGGALIYGISK